MTSDMSKYVRYTGDPREYPPFNGAVYEANSSVGRSTPVMEYSICVGDWLVVNGKQAVVLYLGTTGNAWIGEYFPGGEVHKTYVVRASAFEPVIARQPMPPWIVDACWQTGKMPEARIGPDPGPEGDRWEGI